MKMSIELGLSEVQLLTHAAFSDAADQLTAQVNIRKLRETLERGHELLDILGHMIQTEAEANRKLMSAGIGQLVGNPNWMGR